VPVSIIFVIIHVCIIYKINTYFQINIYNKLLIETYEEAVDKLARLEKEEHVFTLESDNDATLTEKEAETTIKQNKLKNLANDLKKKMAVHKIGSKIINLPDFKGNLCVILYI